MRVPAVCLALLVLSSPVRAQDDADEDPPPQLPAPSLEEAEPVAPPEPLPAEPGEEEPEILMRIGPGDHPEWEDGQEVPPDYAVEIPGDARSGTSTTESGGPGLASQNGAAVARFPGQALEQPIPELAVGVGAGFARLLAATPIDFFRVDQRLEWTPPEFATFRVGLGASQMFNDNTYLVGGGVRVGMGVPFCNEGELVCDGQVFVQPGVLGGDLIGARFDLNGLLSLRFVLFRAVQIVAEGGYSLLFDGRSLVFASGSVGLVF